MKITLLAGVLTGAILAVGSVLFLPAEPKYEHTYSNGVHCYFTPAGVAIQCVAPQHPMVKKPEDVRKPTKDILI